MTVYKQIIKDLESVLHQFDTIYTSKKIADYKEKREAISNWWKNPTRLEGSRNIFHRIDWEDLYKVAGGKTLAEKLKGISSDMAVDIALKDAQAVINTRNAKMAKKLEQSEITKIVDNNIEVNSDGFNGSFLVDTNKGRKWVRINTIIAGGYNIQALHYRTLVKVA